MTIQTKHELADFIYQLADQIRGGVIPIDNYTVPNYLEALAACINNFDGFYLNRGISPESVGPYQLLADALDSATVYD
jgi:hypothetical protein